MFFHPGERFGITQLLGCVDRRRERLGVGLLAELGDDRILFETDYPHPDSKYPHAVSTFLGQEKLSDESKRRILWDNAVDFYRFPEKLMPTRFDEVES